MTSSHRHDEDARKDGVDSEATNVVDESTDIAVADPDPDEALTTPTEEFDADDVPDPDVAEAQPGDIDFVEPGVETPVEPTP